MLKGLFDGRKSKQGFGLLAIESNRSRVKNCRRWKSCVKKEARKIFLWKYFKYETDEHSEMNGNEIKWGKKREKE